MKQEVHFRYNQLVQDKIDACRDFISSLTTDAQNDAKGSAGDKHETALSMMHLEQEKYNFKLREFYAQKAILDQLNPNEKSSKVVLGSLVLVNQLWVYISTALPKISLANETVFAVSPQSPLGTQLVNKTVGHQFDLQGTSYTILRVE